MLSPKHMSNFGTYFNKKAQEVGRWQLENGVNTNLPFVTESMEADMLDCFETTKILLSTLGFPLFDSISRETIEHLRIYTK